MNETLFAVQVIDDDAKLLAVRRENGIPEVTPMAHARLTGQPVQDGKADVAGVLSSMVQDLPEVRPQALLVLNSQDLEYREFSYPFEAERKVQHAIDFELSTDYPADEYLSDHIKTMSREPGYHTFIAALIRRSVLKERLRVLNEAGFRITGVTSDVSTLGAAFRDEEEAMVMDMGEHHTLFALYRLGVPVLLRKIPIGTRHLTGKGENGGGGLNPLLAEIKRTLHSFDARVGLETDRLFVTGNLLLLPERCSALQQQARTEVVVRSEKDFGVRLEEGPEDVDVNVFAPLIGAAFWKRKGGFFHFLKDAFLGEDRAELSSRRLVRWGVGFVAAFLLLLLLSYGLDLAALRARRDALQTEMRNTFTNAFPQVTRVVDELKQARNLLASERSASVGGNPQGGVSLLEAMRSISAAVPETIPFQIVSLFWETGKIEIYARTDAFKTVNTIQELLAGSKDIDQAVISNARHREEGQDVEFKLSIRLAG